MHIRTMMFLLAIGNIITLILLVGSFTAYRYSGAIVEESHESNYRSSLLADELRQSSDDLTRLVRTYVVTNDEKYRDQFFAVLDIRDGKKPRPIDYHRIYWDFVAAGNEKPRPDGEKVALVELMKQAGFTRKELSLLQEAKDNSDALVNLEVEAMSALKGLYANDAGEYVVKGEVDDALARALVHSQKYHDYKADIMKPIDEFLEVLEARTRGQIEHATENSNQIALLLLFCIGAVLVSVGITLWLVFSRLIYPINSMTSAMGQLAGGELEVEVPGQSRTDEIGDMAAAVQVFKEAMNNAVQQNWVKTRSAEVATAMQKSNSLERAGDEVIQRLTPLLDGGHGAFYVYDDERKLLELRASYAYQERKSLSNKIRLGEGLVGQCAQEQKAIIVSNVPDDYVKISSGLGEAVPRVIIAYPILLQRRLCGVLEIAAFNGFETQHKMLLEDVVTTIALYIDNLKRSKRTEQLLEKTQKQSESLKVSEEELRSNEEALKSNNEELQKQAEILEKRSRDLQISDEELRTQEEELRTINEELIEKTKALEEQQLTLEKAKSKAEENARELERASRYKSQFLANMSHELRTPLNSLLILAKDLAGNSAGHLDDEELECAEIIHDSGTRLLYLINDILDLSKIEAGEMELFSEQVKLQELISFAERLFKPLAEKNGLNLRTELAKDLPEELRTDRVKVEQILSNLLSNACKFTRKGGVSVSMQRLSSAIKLPDNCDPSCSYIAIAVEDTGIGISPDKQELVFEAFKQSDGSTTRQYGGTGLGLSISLRLAELLGGGLQLDSKEGAGSTFTLFLPIIEGPSEGPLEGAGKSNADRITNNTESQGREAADFPDFSAGSVPATGNRPPMKPVSVEFSDDRDIITDQDRIILVIEDDQAFCKVLFNRVHQKGSKCIVATDGESGLDLVSRYQPDGIILDLGLPDMNGWTVMSDLKANPDTRHIPIHIVSGVDEHTKGLELGAVGYLTKPVSREQIEGALERIEHFISGEIKQLLIVDDDPASRTAITKVVAADGVKLIYADTAEQALEILRDNCIDCMVLDLGLPGMSGFELLEKATQNKQLNIPPVVIYSAREMTAEESLQLREYTDSVVIKGTQSGERLLDEVTLFLHSVHKTLSPEKQSMLKKMYSQEDKFEGKTVLVVDDDMRNVFALSKALRGKGLQVEMAKDGASALDKLHENPGIDLVLMDVMMPGMDGLEATRQIRNQEKLRKIPVIAITAKAMRGDQEKCMEAGANDYLPKPVDTDKLFSMLRVWL